MQINIDLKVLLSRFELTPLQMIQLIGKFLIAWFPSDFVLY